MLICMCLKLLQLCMCDSVCTGSGSDEYVVTGRPADGAASATEADGFAADAANAAISGSCALTAQTGPEFFAQFSGEALICSSSIKFAVGCVHCKQV